MYTATEKQANAGKIIVALSGGVDSSVTAKILVDRYPGRVEALFMKNWEEDDTETHCTTKQDMQDAQWVCDQLQIPLHKVNLSAEYWRHVFAHFLKEYQAGRTPNPDIDCNSAIKFGAFLTHAQHLGADMIATGHYARRKIRQGQPILLKGCDPEKDQSYFLYRLNQKQLAAAIFPIGEKNKKHIRKTAETAGFINHDKKDSTGICFIGERLFRPFLRRYIEPKKGEIQTLDGQCIGEHDGAYFYTVGQRQGLGIGGTPAAGTKPWYVASKDIKENIVYVVQGYDHPLLFSAKLTASHCHWISRKAEPGQWYQAKIRYRQDDQACRITENTATQIKIEFAEPQRAITPGQSVVLYDADECLGGGIIDAATF